MFKIISSGEYIINGFNNKRIRKRLYEDSDNKKNIGRMTRVLSKLRVHGIIKKVARKNKYYLTTMGRKIASSILLYTGKELLN